MKKLIKENYLFLILFLIIILKDAIYNLITIQDIDYTPMDCHNIESEYNKLLEFNEIDLIYNCESFNTYIIYKDIYNYLNEITIRGGKDKELNNNPVIYDNTLVGVISKSDNKTSVVKLVTNNTSKIPVKINSSLGVLEYTDNKLVVRNISNYEDIKVGDNIYTSSFGNMQENIYVGLVKEITLDNKNIEKIITVEYPIDIKDLSYVTVLKNSKES